MNKEPQDKAKKVKTLDPDTVAKQGLEALNKRRFIYTPAYEIYGGVKGLYDYGPVGSAITANVLDFWREWFIVEEDMLQISTCSLGPESVFKASGHLEKFTDFMVKDPNGDAFRADHLFEEHIETLLKNPKLSPEERQKMELDVARADDYNAEELGAKLREYNVMSPDGLEISDPYPFNLMFCSQIGATGKSTGYFRPETAQGMFVNFGRLFSANGSKLPFATAQIGLAYRNEIAPRQGVLRVREFTMAEIEHFVDPDNKEHEKFDDIKHIVLPLYPCESQLGDKQILHLTVEEAVAKGHINNQTLAYFITRTYLFLIRIGAKPDRIRFRQHLSNEMAHYAKGCWDAEIQSSYGWIECAGHADRDNYDLSVHIEHSGKASQLTAFVPFPSGPRDQDLIVAVPNRGLIGSSLKGEAKKFFTYLESIKDNQDELAKLKAAFETDEETVEVKGLKLTKEMMAFKVQTKKVAGRTVIPGVIEPSYGIGRIVYSILEHAFWVRDDNKDGATASTTTTAGGVTDDDKLERVVLSLKPIIAPYKCIILPLVCSDATMLAKVKEIDTLLKKNHLTSKVDKSSAKIGRRYARADEIGIPFGVTIDEATLKENTVTFRERDSTQQVRVPIADLPGLLNQIVDELLTWQEIVKTYGLVEATEK